MAARFEPLLLVDEHWASARVQSCPGGLVAAFSARHPDESGPNQDCAGVFPSGASTVLAVADGVGGQRAGHVASRIAVDALSEHLSPDRDVPENVRSPILDAFEAANSSILGLGLGAATTLAVVELRDGKLRPYHAGDSSILVCGGRGKLKFASVPHSPVGYGVEAGLIDAEAALHHEELNVVSNMLGSPNMHIELGAPFALNRRDTVLLGTDGLFDNMHVEEVIEIIRRRDLETAANELARSAAQRMREAKRDLPSKPDDLTFLIYRAS